MINETDFIDWKQIAHRYAMLEARACQRAERYERMFWVACVCSIASSVLLLLEKM